MNDSKHEIFRECLRKTVHSAVFTRSSQRLIPDRGFLTEPSSSWHLMPVLSENPSIFKVPLLYFLYVLYSCFNQRSTAFCGRGNEQMKALGKSLKKSLFPVQRLATIVASRAAASFFFSPLFGKKIKVYFRIFLVCVQKFKKGS